MRRTRPACRRVALVSLALVAATLASVPARAGAQQGGAPHDAASAADSVAARGDTTAALRMLDSALHVDRLDAEAWHRRGLIYWYQAKAKRSPGVMPAATIKLLMKADTSLRMARLLQPDSARYALALGNFQLESKFGVTRYAAQMSFRAATEAAERVTTTTPEVAAGSAGQLAAFHWRRYQGTARQLQWFVNMDQPAFVLDAMGANPVELYEYVALNSKPLDGLNQAGEAAYMQAETFARRALAAVPDDSLAQRMLFAVLADGDRWEELERFAAKARRQSPGRSLPPLALGLALHRQSRRDEAEAAFDTALALMPAEERDRLTSLARLMRSRSTKRGVKSDSMTYASYPPEQRAWVDSVYWAFADPLAMTPENEFRAEFLARVAFAEIAWTVEEMQVKGAETERGDIYIRYGPPGRRNAVEGGELWRYPSRLAFVFLTSPMFGTARLGSFSATRAELLRATTPVSFAETPLAHRVDSVDVQLTRFRVDASRVDSADVFVAGAIPVDSMLRELEVRRTTMELTFGVWTAEGLRLAQQVSRVPVTLGGDAGDLPRMRTWRQRVPMGELVYRVEAVQYDGLRGARGRGLVTLTPAPAFGTSDLLVAAGAGPRPGVAPQRWSDLAIAPSAGTIARGAPVALVWETYGLADSAGTAHYRVTVSVQRRRGNRFTTLAARVIGGGDGRSAQTFERTIAAQPSTVDWLTLDVGKQDAGDYVARVVVEDLVARATATVERTFRIR